MIDDFRELAAVKWAQMLSANWERFEERFDEQRVLSPMWIKKSAFFAAYLELWKGNFDFTLHTVDEEAMPTITLPTADLEEAKTLADKYIRDFVDIGLNTFAKDEVRLVTVFQNGTAAMHGVSTDGKVYRFNGSGWLAVPMKIVY